MHTISSRDENDSQSSTEEVSQLFTSMCQKDVRLSVQKSWRTMAFSRVSTGDSVIPSSCKMKYEPAFKPLQETRPSFETGHIGVHST